MTGVGEPRTLPEALDEEAARQRRRDWREALHWAALLAFWVPALIVTATIIMAWWVWALRPLLALPGGAA
jgi:hypothetical protein